MASIAARDLRAARPAHVSCSHVQQLNMGDTGNTDILTTDSARLTADSGFSELLRSAEQLSAVVEGNEDLPQVERNLRQILEASNELWSRVTQTSTQDNEAQAYVNFNKFELCNVMFFVNSLA